MQDVDETGAPEGKTEEAATTPRIDGSVDALVANLRAARSQFAALLEGTRQAEAEAPEASEKDRTAA